MAETPSGAADAPVRGLLLEDLTDHEAAIIDAFEDEEYDKRLVSPRLLRDLEEDAWEWAQRGNGGDDAKCLSTNGTASTSTSTSAWAYIWVVESMLDNVLWLPVRDFVPYREEYLVMCDIFVREELPDHLRLAGLANGAGLEELRLTKRRKAKSYVDAIGQRLRKEASPFLLRLSAFGNGVALAGEVAASLESEGLARIHRICTSMSRAKPHIVIYFAQGQQLDKAIAKIVG